MSKSLDFIGSDPGSNCLQRLLANDTSKQNVLKHFAQDMCLKVSPCLTSYIY